MEQSHGTPDAGIRPSRYGLIEHGLRNINVAYWNLGTAQLLEHAVRRHEGLFATGGAYVVRTGQFTGRSPKDKFIVRDDATESTVQWGPVNQPMSPANFDRLYSKLLAYWQGHDLFVMDCFGGADPRYTLPIRVITQHAWHALFARQLFVRPDPLRTQDHVPEFTVFFAPRLQATPSEDGTNSETCIVVNFTKRVVLICGTSYAGEMKKCVFTILNYLLPARDILPMHCSSNVGHAGDVALFFGLSGTGKTTLSADPQRHLIGDDEHGWSDHGVFNFEGGCYAKCIKLTKEREPLIWDAIRFGSVIENVVVDPVTREPDYFDDSITENTRCAYPLDYIANAVPGGLGGHPRAIVFLACDAFGVLPPVARLSPAHAMYHFMSGYTASLAGTETNLGRNPVPTFSACFGAPFLPLPPQTYAEMLARKMREHKVQCYLLNTGWVGEPFGQGPRIPLWHNRHSVAHVLNDLLDRAEFWIDPVFGFEVPKALPEMPPEVLDPRLSASDIKDYERRARDLAARFIKNFEQFKGVSAEILAAGPKV